eukprot:TRINITY_DN19978_c0_g1_i1.p1 TRINITY_DN19978_c0_g1~~TRINITY_DN19978_c0_g1_i1.p1  ORF type:complete len:416 (+),score=102.11 TRINITY_DN19978_c0_g1_i1:448-1695(+)
MSVTCCPAPHECCHAREPPPQAEQHINMLSLGDLLGDTDSEDVESTKGRPPPKEVPKPKEDSGIGSAVSKKSEESKARLERLRQEQRDREAKQKEAFNKLREISGIPSDSIPKLDSFRFTPSPKKPAKVESAKGSPKSESPKRKQKRARSVSSDSKSMDSLDEYGVMVADRGTQTHLGHAMETQTDPPAKVFSCRECYKKHFGREPQDFDAQCEHRTVVDRYDNDYEDFCNIVPPSVPPISASLPTTAHWKLQLSKMHHMLSRTMSSLRPDVELAGKVLETQAAAAVQAPDREAEVAVQPVQPVQAASNEQLLKLVASLEAKLTNLQAAHEDLLRKHELLSQQAKERAQPTTGDPAPSTASQPPASQPQPLPPAIHVPAPAPHPQAPPAPPMYYPPYYGYAPYPYPYPAPVLAWQ